MVVRLDCGPARRQMRHVLMKSFPPQDILGFSEMDGKDDFTSTSTTRWNSIADVFSRGNALGASEADRQRLIVNIQGDGSACFHIAELDTYARFGCRILTIIMNNYCWGMSLHGQELLYGNTTKARPAAPLSSAMDFAAVAKGAGCMGEKVTAVKDIKDATSRLIKGLDAGKPGLLELVIDDQPTHPGTVAMVGNTNNQNEVVIPYYDNVPRTRYG